MWSHKWVFRVWEHQAHEFSPLYLIQSVFKHHSVCVFQRCRRTHWSSFCWLSRTARRSLGKFWCFSWSRSWKLGSLRPPRRASVTWCSFCTELHVSRWEQWPCYKCYPVVYDFIITACCGVFILFLTLWPQAEVDLMWCDGRVTEHLICAVESCLSVWEWVCYVVTPACLAGQECHSCPRVVHFFLPPPFGGIVKGVDEMFLTQQLD